MTTNQEWLFSLTLEEYLEWMESEHYEPNPDCSAMLYRMYTENMKHEPCSHYKPKDDVSGYGADFNVAEPNFDNIKAVEMDASRFEAVEMDASRLVECKPDSREKLEADVLEAVKKGFITYETLIEWLDRQAAITFEEAEANCKECFTETYKRERKLGEAIDGLIEQVDELTAERVKLRSQICKLEDDLVRANDENERVSFADRIRFVDRIDELTAERDNLADDLLTANRQREQYRKLLSRACDNAHDTLVAMDEGLA